MITLRTKFRVALPRIITDGTFNIGSGGTGTGKTTNRYTYAGDIVTGAASLYSNGPANTACSNQEFGIFFMMGGSTTANIYNFSNDAVTNYILGAISNLGCAVGNKVKGLLVRGENTQSVPASPLTRVVTYAPMTDVAGGNLTIGARFATGCGTKENAYIAVGGESPSANTNKYGYATDVAVGATAFKTTMWRGAAASNGTRGIFRVWGSALVTQQYLFASDATVSGSNLSFAGSASGQGAGSSDVGIFSSSGATLETSKYIYAGDVTAVGGSFLVTGILAQMSNGLKGVTL